jgi:integrase/recombinase XerC
MEAAPMTDPLTVAQAARIMRDAVRDKTYRGLPLGEDVADYLRHKRKRLTVASYRGYESSLDKLARHFPDLRVEDFEPPAGSQRLEEFLDDRWGAASPGTYNVNLSIVADFFAFWQRRGRLHGTPTLNIERARGRAMVRTTFTLEQRTAIFAGATELRDKIALRLLLEYGLRKGALRGIRFADFDHERRRLTIVTKGQTVRALPLPDPHLWMELERLILDWRAEPGHFLMCLIKPIPRAGVRRFPTRAMSSTALHRWWYRRLADAGVVATGETHGQRMHKARHTAGQRILDTTGNLKAVQSLLGHASISTSADIYTDWDVDQLARSLMEAREREDR